MTKCEETFIFNEQDDYELVIFSCQLEKGHKGKHREEDTRANMNFTIEWEKKQ